MSGREFCLNINGSVCINRAAFSAGLIIPTTAVIPTPKPVDTLPALTLNVQRLRCAQILLAQGFSLFFTSDGPLHKEIRRFQKGRSLLNKSLCNSRHNWMFWMVLAEKGWHTSGLKKAGAA